MGQGIAADLLTKTDYEVILLDVEADALQRTEAKLRDTCAQQVKALRIREEDAKGLEARVSYTQAYKELKKADSR